jgi:hypothetical protein
MGALDVKMIPIIWRILLADDVKMDSMVKSFPL